MCSYKLVHASFEVWGFQTRVEDFIQKCIRDVLLLGHRQAFTWIDSWLDMSIDDVREYEKGAQAETNAKVLQSSTGTAAAPVVVGDTEPVKKIDADDEKSTICNDEDEFEDALELSEVA